MAIPETAQPSPDGSAAEGVVVARRGALVRITLDRPAALNALSRAMKRTIAAALAAWAGNPDIYALVFDATGPRAFCAGADLAEFRDPVARHEEILDIQAEETHLLWQVERCIKPSVALIDGLVMGSGVGLSMFGTHRVAGAGYRFAMPETAIGFFPDAGATHFLGRLPDRVGVYLGLTGTRLGRADAYALGLVTHCIDNEHYDDIRAGLQDADPVDPLLDERHAAPGAGELEPLRPAIARCFGHDSVEAILSALDAETGPQRDWAQTTRTLLSQRSPSSLKITLRQLHAAAGVDLKSALEMEYRMAVHRLSSTDFQEGIRTVLVDKGATPRWSPSALPDVTPAMVEAVFASAGARELVLPPRPPALTALA